MQYVERSRGVELEEAGREDKNVKDKPVLQKREKWEEGGEVVENSAVWRRCPV